MRAGVGGRVWANDVSQAWAWGARHVIDAVRGIDPAHPAASANAITRFIPIRTSA